MADVFEGFLDGEEGLLPSGGEFEMSESKWWTSLSESSFWCPLSSWRCQFIVTSEVIKAEIKDEAMIVRMRARQVVK